eukprot:6194655-Pleurochrysis_carterae.AAC.3
MSGSEKTALSAKVDEAPSCMLPAMLAPVTSVTSICEGQANQSEGQANQSEEEVWHARGELAGIAL